MKYSDIGFRAIHHQFCAFPLTEELKKVIAGYPGADKADCVLCYGFIDHEAGLSLELLAAGVKNDKGCSFFQAPAEAWDIVRFGAVADQEFFFFDDKEGTMKERYAAKIKLLDDFNVSEQIEKTRGMGFLDASRAEFYPDDVDVMLIRQECEPELCLVRISGCGEHFLTGNLIEEPDQEFGYHKGDQIAFVINKDEKTGKITCRCDMNPTKRLTAKELEDGSLLKEAISAFTKDKSKRNLLEVLELLRDSRVLIPCTVIYSEGDRKRMAELVELAKKDPAKVAGKKFKCMDPVKMIPEVLKNGENHFLAAFSDRGIMGDEYLKRVTPVSRTIPEAIEMAQKAEKELNGIVINAFSEPFVLDKRLYEVVGKLKSRIVK